MKISKGQKKVLFSVLIVGALIGVLKSGLNLSLDQAWDSFKKYPLSVILLALACDSAQVLFMILRFWALLPKGQGPSLGKVMQVISTGHVTNTFAPARAGEALKVILLSQGEGKIPLGSATGIFVADKVADIIALLIWVVVSGSYRSDLLKWNPENSRTTVIVVLALVAVLVAAWFLFLRKKFAGLRNQWESFKKGLTSLGDPKRLCLSIFFGICCWGAEIIALIALTNAQGYPLTLGQVVEMLVILNLAISVAVSVANLGTFEASLTFALKRFGVPLETGISIAVAHHAIQFVGILSVFGVISLLRSYRSLTGGRQNSTAENLPPVTGG